MTDPNKKPDDKGKPKPDEPDAEPAGHLPGGDGPPEPPGNPD